MIWTLLFYLYCSAHWYSFDSLCPEGLLEVIQNGKLLGQMRPGTAFGELAILYNCKRTATVKGVLVPLLSVGKSYF